MAFCDYLNTSFFFSINLFSTTVFFRFQIHIHDRTKCISQTKEPPFRITQLRKSHFVHSQRPLPSSLVASIVNISHKFFSQENGQNCNVQNFRERPSHSLQLALALLPVAGYLVLPKPWRHDQSWLTSEHLVTRHVTSSQAPPQHQPLPTLRKCVLCFFLPPPVCWSDILRESVGCWGRFSAFCREDLEMDRLRGIRSTGFGAVQTNKTNTG